MLEMTYGVGHDSPDGGPVDHNGRMDPGREHVRRTAHGRTASHGLGERERSGSRLRPTAGELAALGAGPNAQPARHDCHDHRHPYGLRLPLARARPGARERATYQTVSDAGEPDQTRSASRTGAPRRPARRERRGCPRGRTATKDRYGWPIPHGPSTRGAPPDSTASTTRVAPDPDLNGGSSHDSR